LITFDGVLSVQHVKNGTVRSKMAERTYTMMMMMIAPVGPSLEERI
jgi:hypothetical protein